MVYNKRASTIKGPFELMYISRRLFNNIKSLYIETNRTSLLLLKREEQMRCKSVPMNDNKNRSRMVGGGISHAKHSGRSMGRIQRV